MKKNLLILLTLVFFSPFVINAEELKMGWQKNFLFTYYYHDYSSIQINDGDIISCGPSTSTNIEGLPNKGGSDVIILKNDKDGNLLWQKSWGGNSHDYLNNVIVTEDGNFILFGRSESTDIEGLPNKGSYDAIIVKYDKDGNLLWQKSWGGSGYDSLSQVIETEDGNFILFGRSESTDIEGLPNKVSQDAIILKYDKNGNMLWQKSWGGNNREYLKNAIETEDGNFILFGYTSSTDIEGLPNKGSQDAIIVKYDKDGNMLWQKSWGGSGYDSLSQVIETEDGNFILFGHSESTDIEGLPNKGSQDAIILKYDKNGNMLWQKSWGGNNREYLKNAIETEDESIILVGYSVSTDIEGLPNKGGQDAIIVKYDKDGNLLWQKSWGGNGSDSLSQVIETEDGSVILLGESTSTDIEGLPNKGSQDAIILKYDKNGNMLWQKSWGGNGYDSLSQVIETEDGNFILFGHSESTDIEGLPNKGSTFILVKYSVEYDLGNVETENGSAELKQDGKYGIITPTPNEGYEVDKIIIKDKDGNVLDVEVNKQEDGTYSFELYTDVSVEVLFKEKIENPKTGILDVITIIFVGLVISLSGFFIVKRYNERLEF